LDKGRDLTVGRFIELVKTDDGRILAIPAQLELDLHRRLALTRGGP
jgi:hypothetical protein